MDRLGEAPARRTIHPRRRLGPINQTTGTTSGTSRSEKTRTRTRRRRRLRAGKSDVQIENPDVVEANIVPLAPLQAVFDEK